MAVEGTLPSYAETQPERQLSEATATEDANVSSRLPLQSRHCHHGANSNLLGATKIRTRRRYTV